MDDRGRRVEREKEEDEEDEGEGEGVGVNNPRTLLPFSPKLLPPPPSEEGRQEEEDEKTPETSHTNDRSFHDAFKKRLTHRRRQECH